MSLVEVPNKKQVVPMLSADDLSERMNNELEFSSINDDNYGIAVQYNQSTYQDGQLNALPVQNPDARRYLGVISEDEGVDIRDMERQLVTLKKNYTGHL